MNTKLLLCCLAIACVQGCSQRQPPAPRPALISHVVLAELVDPTEAPQLIADCDLLLADIPGVTSYACGSHIDTGRSSVLADYHVGLFIGFNSTDDYAVYVDHPQHVELLSRWKPRITRLRVYDIHDPTP